MWTCICTCQNFQDHEVFDFLKDKVGRDTGLSICLPTMREYKLVLIAQGNELSQEMCKNKTLNNLRMEYRLDSNFKLGLKFVRIVASNDFF